MSDYTSYYLYQKYEKRGTQDWVPVTPNVYSVNADGTMPLSAKTEDDPNCGYSPTPSETYRWVNMDISTNWVCDGYDKYYKQKKQVSNDSGTTWQDVTPPEYRKGSLYQSDSQDCGSIAIERWVNSGTTCSGSSGYDLYYLQVKQISYDGGINWTTTSDYQLGELIQMYSSDCGYVPPTIDGKFYAEYSNSTTYSADCDSSSVLTSGETKPSGYQYSAMTSAIIGSCVTEIGVCCFIGYSNLTSVVISNGVTTIDGSAFYNCPNLKSVYLPNSLTTIGRIAFYFCRSLTGITIPNSVTTIGVGAFEGCTSLSSCTIGSGVTSIGESAFYGCSGLTDITIPNSVTSVGKRVFFECSGLTSATIGSGLTNIGDAFFSYCISLTSINIPDSVTTIGGSAFYRCSGLTSATIGSGVTSIGASAFQYCRSLTSITCKATTPPTLVGNDVFSHTNIWVAGGQIYVPANSVNAYKAASGWSDYASRITAIP